MKQTGEPIVLTVNGKAKADKEFLLEFFPEMIVRKILDIMTIWYDTQKVSI